MKRFLRSGRDRLDCIRRAADDGLSNGAPAILLVEDETFVRDVTSVVLASSGYEVLTARNAAEAIELYDDRAGEISLLLTDVILPGETGLILAAALRKKNPELKVLFMSGYAEQMRDSGEEDWLAKPFSTESLLGKIRRLLDECGSYRHEDEFVMPVCVGA